MKKVIGIIIIAIIAFLWFGDNKTKIEIEETQTQEVASGSADNGTETQKEVKEFVITGTPFEFSLKELRVKEGDTVRIIFKNGGGTHDWKIDEFNAATNVIKEGAEDTVEFIANKTGEFEYYCSVGNHRELGMIGKLIVE